MNQPKENHPWRRYKNKPNHGDLYDAMQSAPSLKGFLKNLVENWETYQIPGELDEYMKIKNIGDARTAEWLSSFIRRTWQGKQVNYDRPSHRPNF